MLEKDGRLYTENLRTAKATDVFISDGAERVFFPSFTFHGFRYIEITKPESAEISELTVYALYSDISETGAFSSDNPLVDQIYKNAFWGQKSNFVGLPTDCPQRDERMGWTAIRSHSAEARCSIWIAVLFIGNICGIWPTRKGRTERYPTSCRTFLLSDMETTAGGRGNGASLYLLSDVRR